MKKKTLIISLAICAACLLATAGFAVDQGGDQKSDDHGKKPWVVDVEKITLENTDFRSAAWTGEFLQMTLMSITVGGEIGLEMHPDIDQFIRIEQGQGRVLMGLKKDELTYVQEVEDDWAIFIPAGYWHNLVNRGDVELKVYSIYSPAEHAPGTRHKTFTEAAAAHHDH